MSPVLMGHLDAAPCPSVAASTIGPDEMAHNLVWVDGFEPPTSRFQAESADQAALHPDNGVAGRI